MEEKKLTPMRFRPERVERKWGIAEYRIADLGYIDSVALDGWLSGNSISDISVSPGRSPSNTTGRSSR